MVPSMWAPGMRSFIRLRQRRTVVLPQPDGPMKAVIWLACDLEVDVAYGTELAVEDVEVLELEDGGRRLLRLGLAGALHVVRLDRLLPDADRDPGVGAHVSRHTGSPPSMGVAGRRPRAHTFDVRSMLLKL